MSDIVPINPALRLRTLDLEQLTILIVQTLAARRYSFSAHDVTRLVRECVNSTHVQLAGETYDLKIVTKAGAALTVNVEHARVKEIVHALFTQGHLTDYTRRQEISDRTSVPYFLYTPKANALPPPTSMLALAS